MKNLNNSKQGVIFVPYILQNSTNVININSRYATKLINSSLYGTFSNVEFNFGDQEKMRERRKKLDKIKYISRSSIFYINNLIMNNIINIKILQGIPCSGKSTWSKEYVLQNRNIMRISRDDLRNMLVGNVFTNGNENLINSVKLSLISIGIEKDRDLILDDTHCYNEYLIFLINYIKDTSKKFNKKIEIELIDFDTSVDECIQRNNNRVGYSKLPNHIIYHMNNEKKQILIDKLDIDRYYKMK